MKIKQINKFNLILIMTHKIITKFIDTLIKVFIKIHINLNKIFKNLKNKIMNYKFLIFSKKDKLKI